MEFTHEQFDDEYRLYSRSADWELRTVRTALGLLPGMNSAQENARLAAVKAILAERSKRSRK